MVSSSTPGVLHTVMPCSRAAAHVDVVVADRDVRDDPQPTAARAGVEHVGVDPVGEHATRSRRHSPACARSSSCVYGVSSAFGPTISWPGERIQPAVGKTAGHQDAAHAVSSV